MWKALNQIKDESENTCTRCQNPSNNPAGIIPNNNKKHALTSAPLTDTHSQGQTCTRITDMHSGFVINPLFYSTPYQHRSHVILEPSRSCDSSFGPLCLCCLWPAWSISTCLAWATTPTLGQNNHPWPKISSIKEGNKIIYLIYLRGPAELNQGSHLRIHMPWNL